jgi:hypothetical protein
VLDNACFFAHTARVGWERLDRLVVAGVLMLASVASSSCSDSGTASPLRGWVLSKYPMCTGMCAVYDRTSPPGEITILTGTSTTGVGGTRAKPVVGSFRRADRGEDLTVSFDVGPVSVTIEGKGVDAGSLLAFAQAVPLPGL